MTSERRSEREGACPPWCKIDHSSFHDEGAYVHIGADKRLADGITVRLVASDDPVTGALDGPFMLVDAPRLALDPYELDLDEARTIGEALIDLAGAGERNATVLTLPAQRLPRWHA
jgi:hypothetical protein